MGDKDGKNFKDLIQGVRPLKNNNKVYFSNDSLRVSNNKNPNEDLYDIPQNLHLSDNFPEDINSDDLFESFHPSVNYKTIKNLKAGKLVPEKTIDLHGLYLKNAKKIFIDEIQQGYDNGIKILLFIHGKGRTKDQKPVLKNAIYHWAQQHPLILGFVSAAKNMGGAGATILYLKKSKNI